jgi:phosphoenolpyruvate carboxylase
MAISKVEMTLAKVDLQIAEHYVQELSQPEDRGKFLAVFEQIRKEYELVRDLVLKISDHRELLDSEERELQRLQRSIQLRNSNIVPLGLLQVSLLKRWRQYNQQRSAGMIYSPYSQKELLDGALLTINGIAAGMRNTG